MRLIWAVDSLANYLTVYYDYPGIHLVLLLFVQFLSLLSVERLSRSHMMHIHGEGVPNGVTSKGTAHC